MIFDELREKWITEAYEAQKGILLLSVNDQLSTRGFILDLNSLPLKPYPFKELFIRWLIVINKNRILSGHAIIVTRELIMKCPIWKIVKCPIIKITLTKEKLFNKPTTSTARVGTISTSGPVGSINK